MMRLARVSLMVFFLKITAIGNSHLQNAIDSIVIDIQGDQGYTSDGLDYEEDKLGPPTEFMINELMTTKFHSNTDFSGSNLKLNWHECLFIFQHDLPFGILYI